jgi:hypothetical protein
MPQGICYQTTFNIGIECTGGTGFKINGTPETCNGAAITPLPAKVAGGYCFQFATTDPTYAGFSTY